MGSSVATRGATRGGAVLESARSLAAYAVAPAVGLVTGPLLARALGPEGRGQMAAVLQPLTVAEALACFGVPTAMVFLVGQGRSAQQTVRRGLVAGLPFLALTSAVLVVYSGVVSSAQGVPRGLVLGVWAVLPVLYVISIRRGALQGTLRFGVLDLERVASPVLRLVGLALLVAAGVSWFGAYAVLHVVAVVVGSVVLLRPLRLRHGEGAPRTRDITRFATLSGLGTVAIALNSRLDQALLPMVLDRRGLGLYVVAVTLAELPSLAATVAARNVLALHSARDGCDRARLRLVVTVGLGTTVLGSVLVAALSGPLVRVLFGAQFTDAASVVAILSIGTTLSGAGGIASAWLIGAGHPLRGSTSQLAGAAVTAVLLLLLIEGLSPQGAAWISVAAQVVVVLVSAYHLARTRSAPRPGQHRERQLVGPGQPGQEDVP